MYPWLVFLHVLGVFGFLIGHGVSAGVSFALRRERNVDRIRLLLQMSSGAASVAYGSLLVLLVTGILTGFMGQWWSWGWIWLAILLLVVLFGMMSALGSRIFNQVRLAVGLPASYGKEQPRSEPVSAEELDALLKRLNPVLLSAVGFGGVALIGWLMMFKPF
jgi:hypothetical protein